TPTISTPDVVSANSVVISRDAESSSWENSFFRGTLCNCDERAHYNNYVVHLPVRDRRHKREHWIVNGNVRLRIHDFSDTCRCLRPGCGVPPGTLVAISSS